MPYNFTPCLTAVIMALALTGAQGQRESCEVETKYLNGTAGDTLSFQTGLGELDENNHVLWYLKTSGKTLINHSGGEILQAPPKGFEGRLHPNTTTGSLTIQPVSINDTGIYCGEIFDKNNMKICYEFHLTVRKADPFTPTTGPPQNITTLYYAVGGSLGFFGLVCIVLFAVRRKKTIGKCCRGKHEDCSVV